MFYCFLFLQRTNYHYQTNWTNADAMLTQASLDAAKSVLSLLSLFITRLLTLTQD